MQKTIADLIVELQNEFPQDAIVSSFKVVARPTKHHTVTLSYSARQAAQIALAKSKQQEAIIAG